MAELVYEGDCRTILNKVESNSVDTVYLDPPFFTQKTHRMKTRDGRHSYSFQDLWDCDASYSRFIIDCLEQLHGKMKPTSSIFFHCDKSASHIIRILLDQIFGYDNFQSEIIWHYRRWSNSKRGLLNCHQTIFFYSKSREFKFNQQLVDYSPTTNVDQIMQKRVRDGRNKSIYARNANGDVISGGAKKGVPLSDVWEIPFLNPKARERTGYPTQKPVQLLKQIIQISTDPRDLILDPFCGSGTSLVAAKILDRDAIGIDISSEATELTRQRLADFEVSESKILEVGIDAYNSHDPFAAKHLACFDYTPVHRNRGIDGIMKQTHRETPIFLRVQRSSETQEDAALSLTKATRQKGKSILVVITTNNDLIPLGCYDNVMFVKSPQLSLQNQLSESY